MNESKLMIQQFYSITEAQRVLRLSRTGLYYQIKAGKVPVVRMGKRILIPGAYFEKLAAQAMQQVQ
jgi:excisionase family DNA binding protein